MGIESQCNYKSKIQKQQRTEEGLTGRAAAQVLRAATAAGPALLPVAGLL